MNTQIMTISKQEMIIASYALSRSNDNFFAALQMSKCNELVYRLRTGIVHGYFQKKDGSIREFWGTTNPSLASRKTVYPIVDHALVMREIHLPAGHVQCAESEEEERQSEQEIPEVTVLSRIDQYHCHKEHRPNEIRDIE